MRFLLFTFFALIGNLSFVLAQSGCTDPQASNFDESALDNDGSCLYPSTSYQPEEVGVFDNILEENSGLAFFNNSLWTHNDGGGEDKLYRIDTTTLEITKTVTIATADNVDWEDLAESDTHVFIGDFGNNDGNRTDLKIHKISKSALQNSNVVNSEIIEFNYADQTDFSEANNDNNFDCEAFFYLNGNLHLFTKNWVNFKTRHYIIPAEAGNHSVEPAATFESAGLITAATIDSEGTIALLGYTNSGTNFIWLLFDYQGDDIFSGNRRRIILGNALQNGQVESIVYRSPGHGYIGAEEFSVLPAKLLKFSTAQWTQNEMTAIEESYYLDNFSVFPNPFSEQITIQSDDIISQISLFDETGRPIRHKQVNDTQTHVNTTNLATGVYFLQVIAQGKVGYRKVFK